MEGKELTLRERIDSIEGFVESQAERNQEVSVELEGKAANSERIRRQFEKDIQQLKKEFEKTTVENLQVCGVSHFFPSPSLFEFSFTCLPASTL
jgi:hypothetical protein